MGFESPESHKEDGSEKTQVELAQDYLVAYREYKEIEAKKIKGLRTLEVLKDEHAQRGLILRQREILDALDIDEKDAIERYTAIGEKLDPETWKKHLDLNHP